MIVSISLIPIFDSFINQCEWRAAQIKAFGTVPIWTNPVNTEIPSGLAIRLDQIGQGINRKLRF
jgi:hypothetical protein